MCTSLVTFSVTMIIYSIIFLTYSAIKKNAGKAISNSKYLTLLIVGVAVSVTVGKVVGDVARYIRISSM